MIFVFTPFYFLITGEVSTFAGTKGKSGCEDGPREKAQFKGPSGVMLYEKDGSLFVCDWGNCKIRQITNHGIEEVFFFYFIFLNFILFFILFHFIIFIIFIFLIQKN